jgi:ABC-type histidine transport system ATPase subunit
MHFHADNSSVARHRVCLLYTSFNLWSRTTCFEPTFPQCPARVICVAKQVQVLYFTLSTDRNSTTAAVGKHAVYIKMDVQPISMKASGNGIRQNCAVHFFNWIVQ